MVNYNAIYGNLQSLRSPNHFCPTVTNATAAAQNILFSPLKCFIILLTLVKRAQNLIRRILTKYFESEVDLRKKEETQGGSIANTGSVYFVLTCLAVHFEMIERCFFFF